MRSRRQICPCFRSLAAEILEQRIAPAAFSVLNTQDSGVGSFRQALLDANSTTGPDIITFPAFAAGTGGEGNTIRPLTPLPEITEDLAIIAPDPDDWGGVIVDGSLAGTTSDGIQVTAGAFELGGLTIRNFGGDGLEVAATKVGAMITGCSINDNGGSGIHITGGFATVDSPDAADRNFVLGNHLNGITVESTALYASIRGNYIGTPLAGGSSATNDRGNGLSGIEIRNSQCEIIGNVIAGNSRDGIHVAVERNESAPRGIIINRNFIGTDPTGRSAIPNGAGIVVENGHPTIGGFSAEERNVISGNLGDGIYINDHGVKPGMTQILRNTIGLDATGTSAMGNRGDGIRVENRFGLTNITRIERNVVSGNGGNGMDLIGTDFTISSNLIGTNAAGTAAIGNHSTGLYVLGDSPSRIMIGTFSAASPNIVSGNGSHGIWIESGSDIAVAGNYVGTDVSGTIDLGNGGNGVFLSGTASAVIGVSMANGAKPSPSRNIISGNAGHGIELAGTGQIGTRVFANFIGTSLDGRRGLGNDGDGIFIHSAVGNTIGDGEVSNIICANGKHGIEVAGTDGNLIGSNRIGQGSGFEDLGNNEAGIAIYSGADENSIGPWQLDKSFARGNFIGSNGSDGIVVDSSSKTRIGGNEIGLDPKLGRGNGGNGIHLIRVTETIIGISPDGDRLPDERNFISSNMGSGILLEAGTGNTQINANLIEKNGQAGIEIVDASGTAIGMEPASDGTALGNSIMRNAGAGVAVIKGLGNSISANSIFGNGGLRVDLGDDGVTPNDPRDEDSGPNGLQNSALLQRAVTRYGQTLLRGEFDGTALTTLRVEFFANATAGYETFLRSAEITTDANGHAAISLALDPLEIGASLTVSVTDIGTDDTSEFSPPIENIAPIEIFSVARDKGSVPRVHVFDAVSGALRFNLLAFDREFRGGVRLATADVDLDGLNDVIVATGPGIRPQIKVFSGADGSLLSSFFPTGPHSRAGIFVAAGDLDGDVSSEIVVGEGSGRLPRIKVFDGLTGKMQQSFLAFETGFRGGVRVAAGDLDADGRAEILAGTASAAARIRIFKSGTDVAVSEWEAFPRVSSSGVHLAVGNVVGGESIEVIVGSGSGAPPLVDVYTADGSLILSKTRILPSPSLAGVRVSVADMNGDGIAEIIAAAEDESTSDGRLRIFSGGVLVREFQPFSGGFRHGLYVG